jgi:hypothetical protein
VAYTRNKLNEEFDWKKLFKDGIKVEKVSKSEKEKISRRKDRNKDSTKNPTPDDIDKSRREKERLEIDATDSETIDVNDVINVSKTDENKIIQFFNELAETYDTVPTNYTHLWKSVDSDIMTKPFMIHAKMTRDYNEALSGLEITNVTKGILDDNKTTYNTKKIEELVENCKIFGELTAPIMNNVDNRILPEVYSVNELFRFQIKIYIHILSRFLGSHIYMSMKRLLDMASSKSNIGLTENDLNEILVTLKDYVMSTEVKKGKLSYDFLRAHLNFKMDEDEIIEPTKVTDLFSKLTSKLDKLDENKLAENKIISKIDTSLGPYYLSLYQETINALLNYSDGYMRFTKNQLLGIKFLSKL